MAVHVRPVEQAVGPQQVDTELAAQRPLRVVAGVVGLRGGARRRTPWSASAHPTAPVRIRPPGRSEARSCPHGSGVARSHHAPRGGRPGSAQAATGWLQSPLLSVGGDLRGVGFGRGGGGGPQVIYGDTPGFGEDGAPTFERSVRRIPDGPWRTPELSGLPQWEVSINASGNAVGWRRGFDRRAPWWSRPSARPRARTRAAGRSRGRSRRALAPPRWC